MADREVKPPLSVPQLRQPTKLTMTQLLEYEKRAKMTDTKAGVPIESRPTNELLWEVHEYHPDHQGIAYGIYSPRRKELIAQGLDSQKAEVICALHNNDIEALGRVLVPVSRQLLPIGTKVKRYGEIVAIRNDGERYYFLKDRAGSISMMPASFIEKFTEGEPRGVQETFGESLQNSTDERTHKTHGDDPSVTPVHMPPASSSLLPVRPTEEHLAEQLWARRNNSMYPPIADEADFWQLVAKDALEIIGEPAQIMEQQKAKRIDVLLDEDCIATIKRLTPAGGEEISFGGVMGGIRLLWNGTSKPVQGCSKCAGFHEMFACQCKCHVAGLPVGESTPNLELLLRKEWWNHHGCDPRAQYGDDGEMQCNAAGCLTDFRRMPTADLAERVQFLRIRNARNKINSAELGLAESREPLPNIIQRHSITGQVMIKSELPSVPAEIESSEDWLKQHIGGEGYWPISYEETVRLLNAYKETAGRTR